MSRLLEDLVGKPNSTVPELFMAVLERRPDTPMLCFEDRAWTVRDAWEEVQKCMSTIVSCGLGARANRVASYISNRPEGIWSWLATQSLGAVYSPINRNHRGDMLADLLRRSGAHLLVTERSALPELPPAEATGVDHILVVDGDASEGAILGYTSVEPQLKADHLGIAPIEPGAPALLLFTSGTTGRSKAVLIPHNMLARGAARMAEYTEMSPADVVHGWLPLFHLGGVLETLSPLIAGGSLALVSKFSRRMFWDEVRSTRSSVFFGFPSILHFLLSDPPSDQDRNHTLRIGICTQVPHSLGQEFKARFGIPLLDEYGMTEAEPIAYPRPGQTVPAGSCGRPSSDFEIAIFDSSDNRLPSDTHGEIVLRPTTPGVMMLGYEGDEEATVRAWRNLWFHTGDLGYLDGDGNLFFVDRSKDVIRRRGENVSSWEVEAIVLGHPAVAECAAVPVKTSFGEDEIKVVVVLERGTAMHPAELRNYCRGRMARFMMPRYIEIRESMPYTETGKIRKEELRNAAANVWDSEAPEADETTSPTSPPA